MCDVTGQPRRYRSSVHLLIALLVSLISPILGPSPAPTRAQEVPELKVNSTRYIVIDADTGEVFAQRGAHEQAAMASLTKVFTAIEAIEAGSPGLQITTSEADLVSADNSMMGFEAGETFSLEDLLYGLMLPSGNDAANAIARSLGAEPGDSAAAAVKRFVARMNSRVANMGLTNTNLVNPSGWGVPDHYTSAHDLAVFTMYALQYPKFVELISTLEHDTASGGYHLRNNNRLMTIYPNLLGGKTGYDDDAGWCLIEVARRNGNTMISVTMDGIYPDDWYDDNQVLLEYAFEQKESRIAAGAPIAGEIVAFRDPDAALIAQVASAGGSLGHRLSAIGSSGPTSAASSAVDAITDDEIGAAPESLVLGQTGISLQLLSAFLVAAVILAGSSLFTFSQPAVRRAAVGASAHRGRRLRWPRLDLKLERPVRNSDTPV